MDINGGLARHVGVKAAQTLVFKTLTSLSSHVKQSTEQNKTLVRPCKFLPDWSQKSTDHCQNPTQSPCFFF